MPTTRLAEAHEAIACLQRLSEAFQARRSQLAQEVGLSEHQWGVLEEISTEHFMPSMFARRRESSPAAVSKTIRLLLDKGVISVSVSKADGRQRNYVLTPKGKRVMARLRQNRQEAIEDIWLKIERDKLSSFTAFGNELALRIESYSSRSTRKERDGKDALREGV